MLNREWLLLSKIMRMRMRMMLMMMVMGIEMLMVRMLMGMMLMLMGMTEQMVGGEWLQSAMVRVEPAVGEFKHCPHPRLHLKS